MTIKEKRPPRYRHELKFTINQAEAKMLGERLKKLFPQDRNAGPGGRYRVNSLYFDTPYDSALREKLSGVGRREKFRIRYYGESPDFLRLEKKLKHNGLCAKYAASLTLTEAEGVLNGEYGFLLHKDEPVFIELYSKLQGSLLRPKTSVAYLREAYVYGPGNVRITIDSGLCTGPVHSFFEPGRALMGVSDGFCVLEVKYDAYLPDVVRMAVQLDRRAAAYSKYAACRMPD